MNATRSIEDVATLLGFQEGIEGIPGFNLWNLTEELAGHPAGSTVAQSTIERALGLE